jgi:predicted DNA binding CopG/RHH family protein
MKRKKNRDEIPEFNFSKARRVSPQENEMFRKALQNTFGIKRPKRGRPPKHPRDKYLDVHLKIHPTAFMWLKKTAKKRGVGYQTIINEELLACAKHRKAFEDGLKYANKRFGRALRNLSDPH